MKLFADEGVDRQVVDALREAGHDVEYAAESHRAIPDDTLLSRAAAAGRLLLTSDKDFGELVYRLGRAAGGVVLLRLAGLSPDAKARLVVEAINANRNSLANAFCVLTPGQLRLRRQPPTT